MTTTRIFTAATLLMAGTGAFAQSGATATQTASAKCKLIYPITLTKNTDLNFGTIAVTSGGSGTLVANPIAGTFNPTALGVVPVDIGTQAFAAFTVGGEATYVYTITPQAGDATLTNGAGTMTVSAFTASKATGTIGAGTPGTDTFTVGGTLNVTAAATIYGNYTGTFTVTVAYQ